MVLVFNCSSIEHDALKALSDRLQLLTSKRKVFGAVNMVFFGDFLQLGPVIKKESIFNFPGSPYWEDAVNVMIELKTCYRNGDMEEILTHFKRFGLDGKLKRTLRDRKVITPRGIVECPDFQKDKIVTWSNGKRKFYNNQVFMHHLVHHHSKQPDRPIPHHTIVIKANMWWKHSSERLSFWERKIVFQKGSDVDIIGDPGDFRTMDCFLKLFRGCQVVTDDGRSAVFQEIIMKRGHTPHKIRMNGYWVYAVNAEDVSYMILTHSDSPNESGSFQTTARKGTGRMRMTHKDDGKTQSSRIHLHVLQFPINLNHATTGHKFHCLLPSQKLFIGEIHPFDPHWMYSVLSKARSTDQVTMAVSWHGTAHRVVDARIFMMLNRMRRQVGVENSSDEHWLTTKRILSEIAIELQQKREMDRFPHRHLETCPKFGGQCPTYSEADSIGQKRFRRPGPGEADESSKKKIFKRSESEESKEVS